MAGKRSRGDGTRARRAGLSRDIVASTTLELIDDEGVGAASMRAIANRLDVEAQSLYTYVDSRDELFDAVVELVVDELDDDPEVHWAPGDPWRPYLAGMARAVRRYARRHPHAFPLVATRPSEAPWVNPPLRSLRWIEAFLNNLKASDFNDDQALFAYRTFNGYLLGFLLLETGSMTIEDPLPGDGSFASGGGGASPGDAKAPMPGHVTPTETSADTANRAQADTTSEKIDPVGGVDPDLFPTVYALSEGLAYEHYDEEFAAGLENMLQRIEVNLAKT